MKVTAYKILVSGTVQGVGFRPTIYQMAIKRSLRGYVRNIGYGVEIWIEGRVADCIDFLKSLKAEKPRNARIRRIKIERNRPRGYEKFQIVQSSPTKLEVDITPDLATCEMCLKEMWDISNRRFRYPFINCTHCGPRYTIIKELPYDRRNTTMSVFKMCDDCRKEYENPLDRRFHAQPVACERCGPTLELIMSGEIEREHPIETAIDIIKGGGVVAVKGLGGYHLACDAKNDAAVLRIRKIKGRERKPLAVMVRNLKVARKYCEIYNEDYLGGPEAPIILFPYKGGLSRFVAPGQVRLGIMLPYTPIHHLLMEKLDVIVLTSFNRTGEPIIFEDKKASELLSEIDGILTHNREIATSCDDSVGFILNRRLHLMRRSRGFSPSPICLPIDVGACLGVGAEEKVTFCLTRGRYAYMSQHIGDMGGPEVEGRYLSVLRHLMSLLDISVETVSYDMHPDYRTTRIAERIEAERKIGVQHHHAHIASVMAEHGIVEEVIGVSCDGTGYGDDGKMWGCEIMLSSFKKYERKLHLRYVPMPGGEAAIREIDRMAFGYLHAYKVEYNERFHDEKYRILERQIERSVNTPWTSSLGRLFDSVAYILDVCERATYDGEAAMLLEAMAFRYPSSETYSYEIMGEEICVGGMLEEIINDKRRGISRREISKKFHNAVTDFLYEGVRRVHEESGISKVVLCGGCFQNQIILLNLSKRLSRLGFEVYTGELVPNNDGGISLGQAIIGGVRCRESCV